MLLFLDIDGVMVPAQGWKSPEIMMDGFPVFSQRATRVLQQLVSDSTTVLLTTSHRSRFNVEEWKTIFKNRGIIITNLNSLPEYSFSSTRKEEIVKWVNMNHLNEPFLILDDDNSLNDLPNYLKENLVQTSSHIGLTENHLPAIEAILHIGLHPA